MRPPAGDAGRPRAVVFLNGMYASAPFDRRVAAAGDLVLAADGGAARLYELGLRPDAVVGDFDSLDPDVVSRLAADGVTIERHPVRKDRTDAELAVEAALSMGARSIVLTGGARGALDHVLGHLAVLRRLASACIEAALVDVSLWATAVAAPADLLLAGIDGRRVSLVAPTDALVTLKGFEYELEHARMSADGCLGLGNTARGPRQSVRVHQGPLFVLVEGDGLSVRCVRTRPAER